MADQPAEIVGFRIRCECGVYTDVPVEGPFICSGCGTKFERRDPEPPFTGKESFFWLKGGKED